MPLPKMDIRVNVKKNKLEKVVTNSSNQLKNKKHKKIKTRQTQKVFTKTKNLLAFCPFCSSDESFNQNKMRCTKCGIIVNQLEEYGLMESKL